MANIHRGEVTVSVAGRAYTLRPTFHIMCQLEERLGLTVPELLRRIGQKGLLASEILMILAVATQHDGSQPFRSEAVMELPAEQVKLDALMPAIADFLMQALGGKSAQPVAADVAPAFAQQASLDYLLLLELAYKVLRLEPQSFWQMTMPELRVLLRAARAKKAPSGIASEEVRGMMQRFPDRQPAQAHFEF